MGELLDKLTEYVSNDYYPFHMPGHKRHVDWKENPYHYDITEIDGFDDLHNPTDILAKLNKSFESIYGSGKVFLTVNGSTVGILSGISALVDYEDTILIGRNCHKSVYNAVYVRKAKVEYIFPHVDSEVGISLDIKAEDIEQKFIENPKIKAVVITSPTYEGVISDIKTIANVVHSHGAKLIVDGAHGAHLGIVNGRYITDLGADIVIMSIHKTLPAFTQTALVWVNADQELIKEVAKYINIYESSSPSYLLMCGAEKCLEFISNRENINNYNAMINEFRYRASKLEKLFLYTPNCEYDIGKIVIGTTRTQISGKELKNLLLNKYKIELEMASENYALAMSTVADTKDGFERLINALIEIDRELITKESPNFEGMYFSLKQLEIYEADKMNKLLLPLEEAEGKISGGYIFAYPPGIPWVVPGEIISKAVVKQIIRYKKIGIDVRGICDGDKILTIER